MPIAREGDFLVSGTMVNTLQIGWRGHAWAPHPEVELE